VNRYFVVFCEPRADITESMTLFEQSLPAAGARASTAAL
jgi:hypothetical protein